MKKFLSFLIPFILLASLLPAQPHISTIDPCMKPFYHGVASGDPMSDRVIIWTRFTPDTNMFGIPVIVSWKMATDTSMVNIVATGSQIADTSKDYTVKVDVTGLQPSTWYFYEFSANGYNSVVGRTRTTPSGGADSLRFAITSCANFEAGFFNVYASLLQRADFDCVLALGDYIYEYETGGYSPNSTANRQWSPANEIISRSDYRTRYSSYKLDEDLRRLHQQFPFVIVWDDHESANDAWTNGADNHQTTEGSWAVRKDNAKKAFFEWQPIRQTSTTDPQRIFRSFAYGNLVDLLMLDTRLHGRDQQAGTSGATVTSGTRQLLGSDQFQWLKNKLDSSSAQWKILGQQVMVAPLKVFGVAVNGDQWDGYPAQRDSVINYILNQNIHDVVAITGDIHSSWANDVPTSSYNSSTGAGSAFVEFVTPSVTSPGLSIPLGSSAIMASNGHIKYADLSQHGYIILDINQTRTQSDWFYVSTIDYSSTAFSYGGSFYVNHLERFLRQGASASVPRNGVYYTMAPLCPRVITTAIATTPIVASDVLLGLYPNPSKSDVIVQFYSAAAGKALPQVYDLNGKLIYAQEFVSLEKGVNEIRIKTEELSTGIYFLSVKTPTGDIKTKFIKE